MQYFDVGSKTWKSLISLAPATEFQQYYCAESVGRKMFVSTGYCVCSYDMERNVWEKHTHSRLKIENLCTVGDYMYAVCDVKDVPLRYSFSEQEWQTFSKSNVKWDWNNPYYISGAAGHHSKLYVLYGRSSRSGRSWVMHKAVLHCFDPSRNVWEEKASTCHPHFGSTLFVVNNRIHVAGGCQSVDGSTPCGHPAPVEVYDQQNNKWSVVEQKHIPPNNLGAVEIESKIYFIINKFPVDSGIRIPPGELYPVSLEKWKNLSNISNKAALCNMPVKTGTLKTG